MFEKATRLKFRFPSAVGNLTVEDLWDLRLTNGNRVSLDNVAKAINKQLKSENEESFVNARTKNNEELELKLEILKHIIRVKQDEKTAFEQATERRIKRQKILEIIENKENTELASKELGELRAMIDELDKAS